MEKDFNGKDISKKVKEMNKKTLEARKYFNLPDTETVIQDYSCSHGMPGRLYITQNYFGFKGGSNIVSYPFQKVKSVKKVHLASIEIEVNKPYVFKTFSNRAEALQILEHLLKNVPSYTKKSDREELMEGGGDDDGGFAMDFGDVMGDVDTGSTTRALQKIHEAQENGIAGLQELDKQRNLLNNINDKLDNITYTLDDNKTNGIAGLQELDKQRNLLNNINDKLDNITYTLDDNKKNVKAMESFGGMISSKFTRDKKEKNYITKREELKDLKPKEIKRADLKIEILFKHKNDDLTSATMNFKGQGFVCYKAGTETLVETKPETAWKYDEVKQIVLRARHQHLDVWFTNGSRIRLMSAHMQPIVNELCMRHPERSVPVEFEPGVLKFDYGSPSITYSFSRSAGVSSGVNSSSLISKDAPTHVKKAIQKQDKDLDQISKGLDTLQGIALTMNEELVRGEEQLKEAQSKMETVSHKMGKQTHDLQNILDS